MMASCEKCWSDSGGNHRVYQLLISARDCTPEEQAGPGAGTCPECLRKTVHQHMNLCLVPDCFNVTGEVIEDGK